MTETLKLRFLKMSREQLDAEHNCDLKKMADGTFTRTEMEERMAAWKAVGERDRKEVEHLERVGRLAQATGCPHGKPVLPWLIKKGLLVKTGLGYSFTPKAAIGGKGGFEPLMLKHEYPVAPAG